MAAETTLTITLQARDWELIVGLSETSRDTDLQRLRSRIMDAYDTTPIPSGGTITPISTKERVVVKIYKLVYETAVVDNTVNPGSRILAALSALNNVADNYISTQIAAIITARDTFRTEAVQTLRKLGRAIITMDNYDNA